MRDEASRRRRHPLLNKARHNRHLPARSKFPARRPAAEGSAPDSRPARGLEQILSSSNIRSRNNRLLTRTSGKGF